MGPGIQPAPVQQSSGGASFLDVFKVLFEPAAVFERVRERPKFLVPFLTICAVQVLLFFVNLPYMMIAVQAQMASRPTGAAGATPPQGVIVVFGLAGLLIFLALVFLISALILWVLVSLFGGEGKFGTLLSVTTYSGVPAVVLLGIVGTIVLHMQGTSGLTSPQDMQPALGLDLLAPGAKGFVGAILKGINPFSLWGLVLTGIGVATTHRLAKSTGYTIATIAFVIGLLFGGAMAAVFGGRAG